MKLQVHVHEDPLLAAKQNSLCRPKRKIPRREKSRQLRQVSEQTMSITKQAKKILRTLQRCDDVMNKVCTFMVKFSIK